MNWTSEAIRSRFIQFFQSKNHKEVPSAPMVIQNDPSLMFTNAGMNQFKDIFIGNKPAVAPRVVNSQKCLRVSGKHNDLEEVGVDTYHHTMFEMLGNWSFGDYFKEEAIQWAWEFLTEELKIDKDLLYVTIFEGDAADQLSEDKEARQIWEKYVDKSRVLSFGKKDNFWEMGDTGPCGPCSEIHIDLRSAEDKVLVSGSELVNRDHSEVIEIWNLVFIQYNRNKEGLLSLLPSKHVDTGMGLERLCRALQKKQSNYDIDLFRGVIAHTERLCGKTYGHKEETDIAFRVIADHIRPVCFAIAEGQLPSNTGPGYVIRRILRRAIRYAYSKLGLEDSFMYQLVPTLIEVLGSAYPELSKSESLIIRVLREEEESFLRTLANGLKRIHDLISSEKAVSGKAAFELYDTFGFPIDLTRLIALEENVSVDLEGFEAHLEAQKLRSRASAEKDQSDWMIVNQGEDSVFLGYDEVSCDAKLMRYRKIQEKKKTYYQLVFDQTCFYPEGGGQVGDTGEMDTSKQKIAVWDTKKENETILHFTNELTEIKAKVRLLVKSGRRKETAKNHSATHLLHYVLRDVLGKHVEQKGSLVHPDYLRFDFSHFEKLSESQLSEIELKVNEMIESSIPLQEYRSIPISEAKEAGAMSLFGEKYGESVRMICFGESKELCGGIHVPNSAQIGRFMILSEASVASGVRRIEAITGLRAEERIQNDLKELKAIRAAFNNSKDVLKEINDLRLKLKTQEKELMGLKSAQIANIEKELSASFDMHKGVKTLIKEVNVDPKELRNIGFSLKAGEDDRFIVLGVKEASKVSLSVFLSDSLVAKGKDARLILNDLSKYIDGRGGGQAFFATAGGQNPGGLSEALSFASLLIE